ncbi:hypothetical protein [Schaalia hyovaginalis]|uniref:hypothetical protein n=1 Tax=Schaalia hyovaginalis TaxID=29316 RepID=UPI0012B3E9F6|nr:hypothetical protein [Schaalia hyovaginalis]MST63542.1 hypothetical protein [Schaalia hyovaginalis]
MGNYGLWDRILSLGPLLTWGGNLVAISVLVYAMAKGIQLPGAVIFWSLMIALLGSSFEESLKRRQRGRARPTRDPRGFTPAAAPGWTGPQAR